MTLEVTEGAFIASPAPISPVRRAGEDGGISADAGPATSPVIAGRLGGITDELATVCSSSEHSTLCLLSVIDIATAFVDADSDARLTRKLDLVREYKFSEQGRAC